MITTEEKEATNHGATAHSENLPPCSTRAANPLHSEVSIENNAKRNSIEKKDNLQEEKQPASSSEAAASAAAASDPSDPPHVAAGDGNGDGNGDDSGEKIPKLSKNKLRKRRRYERAMEIKKRKKQQKRDVKAAKALAEGRDIEAERREMERRTQSGEGHRRREERWRQRISNAENTFAVCVDCAYEEFMTKKEISSLALQIRYCYAYNKRSDKPCYLSVSNLSGATRDHLRNVEGFPDQWKQRAFSQSEKSLVEMHPDTSKLVYLTSDSENTLDRLDDTKIYVIGGIVDRNRLKRAAIGRAEKMGVATAKLPIGSYLHLVTTKVLTCNHVFEILLKCRENENDWKQAMLDVLPQRKEVAPLEATKTLESKPGASSED